MSGIEYDYEETIEPRQTDAIIRAWPSEDGHVWLLALGDHDHHQAYSAARVPTNPADRHELTEAIHGKRIDAIIYSDGELNDAERVELAITALTRGIGGREAYPRDDSTILTADQHARVVMYNLARWRAALARDAAAKERERVEEASVDVLAGELRRAANDAASQRSYSTFGRIARRAYELGARAPQGEEAGR